MSAVSIHQPQNISLEMIDRDFLRYSFYRSGRCTSVWGVLFASGHVFRGMRMRGRRGGLFRWGSWVTPEQDAENQSEEAAEGRARRAAAKALKDEPEDEIVGIIHERPIGRGAQPTPARCSAASHEELRVLRERDFVPGVVLNGSRTSRISCVMTFF